MTKSFKEALKARRTFYQIENKSTLSDKEIRDLISNVDDNKEKQSSPKKKDKKELLKNN